MFFHSAISDWPTTRTGVGALGQTTVVGAVLHQTLGSAGSERARWPGEQPQGLLSTGLFTIKYPVRKRQKSIVASQVALVVKNMPAMQETRVRFLGWEDSLEEETANHTSIFAGKNPMDRRA